MHRNQEFKAVFHSPDVKAWLSCQGAECHWEISIANLTDAAYHQAETEVIYQPRGEDGLARGGPVLLYRCRSPLGRFPGGQTYWGHATLPLDIGIEVARQCYFRVRTESTPIPVTS